MKPALILAACLALAGCDGAPGAPGLLSVGCGLGARTRLPVEMHAQEVIVHVTINGRSANLIVDTGADHTVLGRGVASVLGVRGRPSSFGTSAVGGVRPVEIGTIERLQVGDQTIDNLEVAISTFDEADGVLGLDVLSRYELDFDLPRGQVILHRGSLCPGEKPPIPGEILEIPAVRGVLRAEGRQGPPDPFLMVPISLDGAKAFAMMDSGALAGSLVSTSFAHAAGASDDALKRDSNFTIRGFGTSAVTYRHRFGELLVGREVFTNPTILVGGGLSDRLPVIIGSDYFLTHRVWMGFRSERVFVVPVGVPAVAVPIPTPGRP